MLEELDVEFEEFLQELDKRRKKKRKNKRKRIARDPARRLWCAAKYRAKCANLPFDIELEDVVIPTVCPLLEIPLTNIVGQGRLPSNVSLDRVDNTKGYVKGNVMVISEMANRMKQNATKEQLLLFAKNITSVFA